MDFMFESLESIKGLQISTISVGWKKNEMPILSRMYDEFKRFKTDGLVIWKRQL
ncbi:MAG: hypothetical protein IT286_03370 [Proteobacteria bacterium]|jgi:hypothetical protein|nr:hypothetical protein [Pseudomonadota bacterium]